MGRLDTADIRVQGEPTNVGDIIREVVASMRTDRPVQVICDKHSSTVVVDRRLIKLAIKQLLDNARKYSPPEMPIMVHVQNGSGIITVAVTDHGEGIPLQEQGRIFDRLYRSPSVERQMPGSGLGLSIALSIVRAHHGELTVTSRPGETTFRLMLPVEQKGERK